MISERELRQIAAKTGVGVGQSEHEYVLLCVLDALGQTSPLADTFCLKGGTALRLVHLKLSVQTKKSHHVPVKFFDHQQFKTNHQS